jgi:hypothetical protein
VGLCFVHVDDPNHACHPSSPRPIGLVCLVYLCSGGTARPWNEAPLPAAGSDSFANMPSDQRVSPAVGSLSGTRQHAEDAADPYSRSTLLE